MKPGPAVKPNDETGLQEFSIALEQAGNAIAGMHYINDLNTGKVISKAAETPWQLMDRKKWQV